MKSVFNFILLLALLIFSCSQPSQTEKDLQKALNKPLSFGELDTVLHQSSLLTIQQLFDNFDYKSVVYLQDNCQSCYPQFLEWHQKMDSLELGENYTILFVIQGNGYSNFMCKVLDLGYVNDKYYAIMDEKYTFLNANNNIPRWIIDAGILIDAENKIKMVGAPWLNEDMTKLFYKTIGSEQSSVTRE